MILAICILAGALMVASVVLGLFFSGFRLMIFGSKFGVQAIDREFHFVAPDFFRSERQAAGALISDASECIHHRRYTR